MTTTEVLVPLTADQAEQVEWAIEPMADLWSTDDGAEMRAGPVVPEADLPTLRPSGYKTHPFALVLRGNAEVNSDLLYRLEVQLRDMAEQDGSAEAYKDARHAGAAARMIRRAVPELAALPPGGGWV